MALNKEQMSIILIMFKIWLFNHIDASNWSANEGATNFAVPVGVLKAITSDRQTGINDLETLIDTLKGE